MSEDRENCPHVEFGLQCLGNLKEDPEDSEKWVCDKCHRVFKKELRWVEVPSAVVSKLVMIKINGSDKEYFRCECGGNVFNQYAELRYRCNACGAEYSGKKED